MRKIIFIILTIFLAAHCSSAIAYNGQLSGTFVVYGFDTEFGGSDTSGGWGVNKSFFVWSSEITFNADGTFTANGRDDGVNRMIAEENINQGSAGDQDFVYSNRFVTTHAYEPTGDSGTYTVSEDGTLTLIYTDEGEVETSSGVISSDMNTILLKNFFYDGDEKYAETEYAVGVLKGNGFEISDLNGTYIIYAFGGSFHGVDPNGGWGANEDNSLYRLQITFNGDGTFVENGQKEAVTRQIAEEIINLGDTGDQDFVSSNKYGTISDTGTFTEGGTYSLDSDGTLTITYIDGSDTDTITGFLGADGKTLLLQSFEYNSGEKYSGAEIGIGVYKGSGFTNADLSGTYMIYALGGSFHGVDPNGGWGGNEVALLWHSRITFNGDGTFTEKGLEQVISRQIIENIISQGSAVDQDFVYSNKYITTTSDDITADSGTYTLASDGTLTIALNESGEMEMISGLLSADGETILLKSFEYDNGEKYAGLEIAAGVRLNALTEKQPSLTEIYMLLLSE